MSLHICRPGIARVRRLEFCPVCREPEPALVTTDMSPWRMDSWITWDCGTKWNEDGYTRPRELIVDENMKRPTWLRERHGR